jgi:hypothetical protein
VANGLLPPHCPLREQVDDFKQRIASGEYMHKNSMYYLFCCVALAYVLIILEIMCILNGQEDVLHV